MYIYKAGVDVVSRVVFICLQDHSGFIIYKRYCFNNVRSSAYMQVYHISFYVWFMKFHSVYKRHRSKQSLTVIHTKICWITWYWYLKHCKCFTLLPTVWKRYASEATQWRMTDLVFCTKQKLGQRSSLAYMGTFSCICSVLCFDVSMPRCKAG